VKKADMTTSGPGNFSLISLGCPKNQVDSEHLITYLSEDGFIYTTPDEAETIIINTCAFIDDAKKESIETILEASQTGKKLIVFGCLAERYKEELRRDMPEVDYFFGLRDEINIRRTLKKIYIQKTHRTLSPSSDVIRQRLNPSHYAYLKISEGCNRKCSFCIIPSIRGPYRSVQKENIIKEAHELIADGAGELIIVAQDSTFYGKDLIPPSSLSDLIQELSQIDTLRWLRILYGHPLSVTDELLEIIALQSKVVNYLDLPLQHSENRILKLMNRQGSAEDYLKLIHKIRSAVPDIVVRTTFIVGFPGEEEKDFEGLISFMQYAQLDRVGAFTYSCEEGTPAAHLPDHVTDEIKQERFERLMAAQEEISFTKNQTLVGTIQSVMIDEVVSQNNQDEVFYIGRYWGQAPDIDGITVVHDLRKSDKEREYLSEGDIVKVRITNASEHDLEGLIV
jgi:ribosomal protein S12 methylthiotransferase